MPIRPAVPGVIKHQLMFLWRGQWCVSTFRLDHGATPTLEMAQADRAVLKGWCDDDWKPYAATDCVAMGVKSWSLETPIPTKFAGDDWYPVSHITGTMGGIVAPGVTFAVSLRTGAAGTAEKPPSGRLYHVGGPPIAQIVGTASHLDGVYATGLGNRYVNLKASFDAAGAAGVWSLVSYWHGGNRAAPVLRDPPLVLPIDHVKWDNRVDFQRRRQPKQQAFAVN